MAIFVRQQNDFEKISSVFLVRLTPYFCSAFGNAFFCLARLGLYDFRTIFSLVSAGHHYHFLFAYRVFLPVAYIRQNRQHHAFRFITSKDSADFTYLFTDRFNPKKYYNRFIPISSLFFLRRNYQCCFGLFVVVCQNKSKYSHDWHQCFNCICNWVKFEKRIEHGEFSGVFGSIERLSSFLSFSDESAYE